MSFCVRDKRTGEYWRSGGGKTAWGTGTAAKQAYAARHRDRLDDSKTHELVDMTQVGIQPYKDALMLLIEAVETSDLYYIAGEKLGEALHQAKQLTGIAEKPEQL